MKEIVIINQWSSYLTKDIVNEFVKRNFKTVLITGNLSESGVDLEPSVIIHRIFKYNKKNKIKRLFSWGVGTIQILFLLWFRYRREYLVFTSNPPTSAFIASVIKNRFSIQILDIYPDALIAGKFIKPGAFIHNKWVAINKKSFAKANYIFTLTDGMRDTISQYVEAGKIISIHQWPASSPVARIKRDSNPFVSKFNLTDSFVVMYSGNMGLGHHVDILVEVANELKSEKNIVFFFIGEGWLKETIQQEYQHGALNPCYLNTLQQKNR
jgi:glycosyltransferase involved in cell wall biosynthesis